MRFVTTLAISSLAISSLAVFAACGPAGRGHNGGDDTTQVDASGAMGAEVCDDAVDNDGDGKVDCSDTDCSGIGMCPVCGSVENPAGPPIPLPDGISSGAMCNTDADCTAAGTPNCVAKECHASYNSTLDFIGFPTAAVLSDPSKLISVCVTMEHSWLRDLQIELITPPDSTGTKRVMILDKWHDRTTAEEIYLGMANDADDAANPVPGTGAEYCWTHTATVPMIDNNGVAGPTTTISGFTKELTPGNFGAMSTWTSLTGVPLNGKWTMRVTDLWAEDNGFIFKWSIKFDPSLVSDCSGPIILLS